MFGEPFLALITAPADPHATSVAVYPAMLAKDLLWVFPYLQHSYFLFLFLREDCKMFAKDGVQGLSLLANVTISFRRENPTHHHINSVTAMPIAL